MTAIHTDSVTVNWTISGFTQSEQYIVMYGINSDTLNLTSSTINSSNDISLVNKTYSTSLEGLQDGTIYYARILAQFGINGLVKRYSKLFAFRTLEEGEIFIDILF